MNLSEYLNVLYPAIGGTQTKEQFIKSLILNSTFIPTTDEDKLKKDELEKHLDELSRNYYDKIYNGHSTLGKKVAREILRIHDSGIYYTFLSFACSSDVIKYIGNKFIEKGFSKEFLEDDNIVDFCVYQFQEILFSIAFKPRKKTQRKEFSTMDLDPYEASKKSGVPAEFFIQFKRNLQMRDSKFKDLQ